MKSRKLPCPVPGCRGHRTNPRHLMCVDHWHRVPYEVRIQVLEAYRRGPRGPAFDTARKRAIQLARQATILWPDGPA